MHRLGKTSKNYVDLNHDLIAETTIIEPEVIEPEQDNMKEEFNNYMVENNIEKPKIKNIADFMVKQKRKFTQIV